ncbi:hypothetical protein J8L85_12535 [Maribacter sp. MMG018]|uniref:hypothetical protein n=1 Tax=Maribacter sp. MMG018 TaxID=2822688 RepID=UPI001B360C10|nr:hypothetical protein [Maribacter sp. MMG018]MBQ4915271.1 hypothetical protein [Maribacter sp. MMG018]
MTKKGKDYFGYLKGVKLNSLSIEEKMDLFVSRKLFTSKKVLSLTLKKPLNLSDSSLYKTEQEPLKNLLDSYYTYVSKVYQEHIDNTIIDFFHMFNNQIYGLKNKQAKAIARLYYINIINNKNTPNIEVEKMFKNENGIPEVDMMPKLELYYDYQESYKYRLIKEFPKGLDEYLMGNSNYFTTKLIDNTPILKEVAQFEGKFKILLSLNDKYRFEKIAAPQKVEVELPSKTKPCIPRSKNNERIDYPIPTEEEMDEYILKHVFSKKG